MRAKLAKLLRLARDPASTPGEAEAAVRAIVRLARSQVVLMADLLAQQQPVPSKRCRKGKASTGKSATTPADASTDPVLTFGKHKGRRVSDVARQSLSYLTWALTNVQDLDRGTVEAIRRELGKVQESKNSAISQALKTMDLEGEQR